MLKYTHAAAWLTITFAVQVGADTHPDSHAPIGVMADHYHESGEVMLSYRFMRMDMKGNRVGSDGRRPDYIAISEPNGFADMPTMPPTLRVVPTEMTMDMHMFGVMYAPSDRITVMGMLEFLDKEMDHITYQGGMGTTRLGTFTTRTDGLGDVSVSALVKLMEDGPHRWHGTLGLSLPTGSIDETGTILTPMDMRPSVRLPYPMQLGSGTYDLLAGLTYAGGSHAWGWGAQWRSTIRLGENDEAYTLGDEHEMTGWASYRVSPHVSISTRLHYVDRNDIDGMDPNIAAPVQTADPSRQGLQRTTVALGANFLVPGTDHRIALEYALPVAQDLSGPQLETDAMLTIGWQRGAYERALKRCR